MYSKILPISSISKIRKTITWIKKSKVSFNEVIYLNIHSYNVTEMLHYLLGMFKFVSVCDDGMIWTVWISCRVWNLCCFITNRKEIITFYHLLWFCDLTRNGLRKIRWKFPYSTWPISWEIDEELVWPWPQVKVIKISILWKLRVHTKCGASLIAES